MVDFRRATFEDFSEISGAFKDVFGKKMSFDYYRWKYGYDGGVLSYVALSENNRIVAHTGFSFKRYRFGNELLSGVSRHSSFVLPKNQGAGIYRKLMRYASSGLKERGIDFIQGWPNINNVRSTFTHDYFYPLSVIPTLTKTFSGSCLDNSYLDLLSRVDASTFPALNITDEFMRADSFFMIVKDRDYFTYRYACDPSQEYYVLSDHNNRAAGAIVLCTGSFQGYKTLKVMDLVGELNVCIDLISSVCQKLSNYNVRLQIWLSPAHKDVYANLFRLGFSAAEPIFHTGLYFLSRKSELLLKDGFMPNYDMAMGDTDV